MRRRGSRRVGWAIAAWTASAAMAGCADAPEVVEVGDGVGEIAPAEGPAVGTEPEALTSVAALATDVSLPSGETTCGALTLFALPAAGGRPTAVAPGEADSVWFTDPGDSSIGHLAIDGAVTTYALAPGSEPTSLASDGAGAVWFTEPKGPSIGRLMASGDLSVFPLPTTTENPMGGPGMGALPTAITAGRDGAMWFVETGADQLGRITPDGTITEMPLPFQSTMHTNPTAIVAGTDGEIWFSATLRRSLGRFDPVTSTFSELPFPGAQGTGLVGGNSLALGADGAIWYADPHLPGLSHLMPDGTSGSVRYGIAQQWPSGLTSGSDGGIWFVLPNDATVARMRPDGQVAEWRLPPDAGPIGFGGAAQVVAASDGAMWFAAPDSNRLGRIECPA